MRIGFDFDGIISRTPLSRAFHFIGRSLEGGYRKVIQTAKPNEWALQFIKILEAKGHTVYIITGRPKLVANETASWLRRHGLGHLVRRMHHNPVRKYSSKQQVQHKCNMIRKLGVRVYIEDNPKVAKGIARETGIEVVLHVGRPKETAKDVYDAIKDVARKGGPQKKRRSGGRNPAAQIIISVPHATGLPVEGATRMKGHDYIAEEMAKRLAERLSVPEAQVIIGDVPRDIIDLNRERARWKTEFRQTVRNAIKRDPHNTIHLDVHSFRQNSKVYRDNDIAIVTTEKRARPYETELRDRIIASGFRSKVYTEMLMDVVPEGRELGVPVSYLIEFNEGADAATKDRYADVVAEFIGHLAANWPPPYPAHKAEAAVTEEIEPQANPVAQERLIRKFAEGATRGSAKNLHIVGDYLKSWNEIIAKRLGGGRFRVKTRSSYGSQSSNRHCRTAKSVLEGIGTVYSVGPEYDFEAEPTLEHAPARTRAPAKPRRRPRTPLRGPTQAEMAHERRRISEMSTAQLHTRFRRVGPQKLLAFAYELAAEGLNEIAGLAYAKLAQLGYNPDGTIIGTTPRVTPTMHPAEGEEEEETDPEYETGGPARRAWTALDTDTSYDVLKMFVENYNDIEMHTMSEFSWAQLPNDAKRQLIEASRAGQWNEDGLTERPATPERPTPTQAPEEEPMAGAEALFAQESWDALSEDTRYNILSILGGLTRGEIARNGGRRWRELPTVVVRALLQKWGVDWNAEGLVVAPLVPMSALRVGDLVKHEHVAGNEFAVVSALNSELNRVIGIWSNTALEAKQEYLNATDEQLRITNAGGRTTYYPTVGNVYRILERGIRRTLEPTVQDPLVAFDALHKGDLIEIPPEMTRIQGGRFAVVYSTGRLMYEGQAHGEDKSVWGIWEETPQFARRKFWDASEGDFRPFIPGLLKHEALEGAAYRVLEHGIFRSIGETEAYNKALLASVGVTADDGMAVLYYPWPEEPDPQETGSGGRYSILKNGVSRIGKKAVIVSTHPEIGLHYGRGWVTPVKMLLSTLRPERILPHRIDFKVPTTEAHDIERFSMVEEEPIDEPFNVRAVGIVKANPECVLCNDLKTPKLHYEDPFIIICDDIKHKDSIMGMIKRHARKPAKWEEKWLMTALNYYAGEAFPDFEIVETMNTEPSHWHIHARKAAENPSRKERPVLEIINSVR